MAADRLEQRVKSLEEQVAQLSAVIHKNGSGKDWRRTVGMFTGDPVVKRIDDAARKFRQADRAKARRPSRRGRVPRNDRSRHRPPHRPPLHGSSSVCFAGGASGVRCGPPRTAGSTAVPFTGGQPRANGCSRERAGTRCARVSRPRTSPTEGLQCAGVAVHFWSEMFCSSSPGRFYPWSRRHPIVPGNGVRAHADQPGGGGWENLEVAGSLRARVAPLA
jgi:hypothetical protein